MSSNSRYPEDRRYNDDISYLPIKSSNVYSTLPKSQSSLEKTSFISADSDSYFANELNQIRRELHRLDVDNSRDREALLNVIKNCKIYIS